MYTGHGLKLTLALILLLLIIIIIAIIIIIIITMHFSAICSKAPSRKKVLLAVDHEMNLWYRSSK